jgi:hypothetical protein
VRTPHGPFGVRPSGWLSTSPTCREETASLPPTVMVSESATAAPWRKVTSWPPGTPFNLADTETSTEGGGGEHALHDPTVELLEVEGLLEGAEVLEQELNSTAATHTAAYRRKTTPLRSLPVNLTVTVL